MNILSETTKTILFPKTKKEMTFEEVVEQFEPMLRKKIWNTNNRSSYNKVETEDFMQELMVELWRAYDQYQPELGYCFSTFLHYKLMKGVKTATYSRYSQKNKHKGLFSMNTPLNDSDFKLEDTFHEEDLSLHNLEYQELIRIIEDNLEEGDEELFRIIEDRSAYTVQDYADKYNITRQAANQRVVKLREKLRVVISKEYLGFNYTRKQ